MIVPNEKNPALFDFVCERVGECVSEDGPWRSKGWDTEEQASARGTEHEAEHIGGKDPETGLPAVPMTELKEFEAMVGFEGGPRS